jgi:single stranded DNA-binding protein
MINEVRIMGRLARDPQLREFQNGGAVCNLRVITSRSWKDPKTGEFKERVEGHNVVIHVAPIARRAADTLKKGSLVYIAGALETRKWEGNDGVTRYTTEIVIRPYQGGTLRRLPTGTIGQSPANDNPEIETEIDYMTEMSGLDTFPLGDEGSDPFS